MRLMRTIAILLVAMSLAALPLASPAMAFASAKAGAVAETNLHHEHHAALDGSHVSTDVSCHHTEDSSPAPQHDSKCPLGSCCIGVNAAVAPTVDTVFQALVFHEGQFPARIERHVPDHAGTPPFRPPRV